MEYAQNNERRSGSRQFHRKSRNKVRHSSNKHLPNSLLSYRVFSATRSHLSVLIVIDVTNPALILRQTLMNWPLGIRFSKYQAKASAWKSDVGNNSMDLTHFTNTEFHSNSQALYDGKSLYGTWQQVLSLVV